MTEMKGQSPDMTLAAVCGLFCEACTLYIATREDPARLNVLAQKFAMSEAQVSCHGCRSHKRGPYCAICRMRDCAAGRGHDFCGECADYPCAELSRFQAERPHRLELWLDQQQIRELGVEAWRERARQNYSCPDCGTLNSAYDLKCRHCGRTPSCPFVERHSESLGG